MIDWSQITFEELAGFVSVRTGQVEEYVQYFLNKTRNNDVHDRKRQDNAR